ncbi:MAG: hypothetical protein ACJ78U_09130, partial [Myxococcales bacterium]
MAGTASPPCAWASARESRWSSSRSIAPADGASRLAARFPLESMGETAENVAAHYKVPRAAQDEFALRSHKR